MISVSEAIKHIETFCIPSKPKSILIKKAMGCILAEDIMSPINMPPFKQSSMDGYAFIHSRTKSYKVMGEVQTGSSSNITLHSGEAVRIFTGARVPNDANTVVMQEHTERLEDNLILTNIPKKGANVRPLGQQIKEGEVALEKGQMLNEAAIGFLAGLGIKKIKVHRLPKVSILVTGNELQQIGKTLKEGQVYDSNSLTLELALKRIGIKNTRMAQVEDDLKSTIKAIKKTLKASDVVLISGGISVGDYDYVKAALEENGVNEVFYKVNQKPGKPLWFGHKKKKMVFALPGNPGSSLSCFYVYVLPLLRAKMGFTNYHLPQLTAKSKKDIQNTFGKTLFLKGIVKNDVAEQLSGQASSVLKSFAISDALLVIPEDKSTIKKGENITYMKLN